MDIQNLTVAEADVIFSALTACRPEFIKAMAQAALRSTAEMLEDMYIDDQSNGVPDVSDARRMASDYVGDTGNDFKEMILKEIQNIPVDMKARPELTITLTF